MTKVEIAYLAGLFEGEGTVHKPSGRGSSPRLLIRMTDPGPLRRVLSIAGGKLYGPYPARNPRWAPSWQWQLNTWDEVLPLMKLLRPWLAARRQGQFDAILAYLPPERPRHRLDYVPCDHPPVPSSAGYLRHLRRGTWACAICLESARLYKQLYKERRRHQPELEAGVLQSPVASAEQSE